MTSIFGKHFRINFGIPKISESQNQNQNQKRLEFLEGAVSIVYGNIVNRNIVFILTSWWGHRKW